MAPSPSAFLLVFVLSRVFHVCNSRSCFQNSARQSTQIGCLLKRRRNTRYRFHCTAPPSTASCMFLPRYRLRYVQKQYFLDGAVHISLFAGNHYIPCVPCMQLSDPTLLPDRGW
uniref:Putative secreted protein n=1 Tax=Ixodes ricinus TaxID=34613 RepID=A0A6B0UKV9_IXORI